MSRPVLLLAAFVASCSVSPRTGESGLATAPDDPECALGQLTDRDLADAIRSHLEAVNPGVQNLVDISIVRQAGDCSAVGSVVLPGAPPGSLLFLLLNDRAQVVDAWTGE